jgi:aldehyde:ferredoxin oxidoreductase
VDTGGLYGWTGKLLEVDLSGRTCSARETADYTNRFIGGKGIGGKLYWDDLTNGKDAFHEDSVLILMTGPLAATPAPSGSRWLVCGKSPSLYPECFASANLGGSFGAQLKKAGYDGLIIKGKASSKTYLLITDGKIEFRNAGHLQGLPVSATMRAIQNEAGKRAGIVTTGIGGENRVRFATVATDAGGSGSVGFGAVMGSKNLKAIAVRGSGLIPAAHPDRIRNIRQEIKRMTGEGYFNLYGSPAPLAETEVVKKIQCRGCSQGCWRSLYRAASGEEGIRKCQSSFFYTLWDKRAHGDLSKATFLATSFANEYSLCTMELPGVLIWLEQCIENGIISEKETELPMGTAGSIEFIRLFIDKITKREGFGGVLAEGVMRAADMLGRDAKALALGHFTQTGRGLAYGPKVFSPSALIYATEPRPSVTELHEICEPLTKWALWFTTQGTFSYLSTDVLRKIAKRFWGSKEAADFSSTAGKALAAVAIQNRQHVKDALILCDFAFPIMDDTSSIDHVGDAGLESRLFSAVTGIEVTEEGLNTAGERIFNLLRAIYLREGRRGKADDYLPESQFEEKNEPVFDVFGMFNPDLYLPGKDDEIISRKGKALLRNDFRQMLHEYYCLRGWDPATGLFTRDKLIELGLQDVIQPLKEKVI